MEHKTNDDGARFDKAVADWFPLTPSNPAIRVYIELFIDQERFN